MANTQITHKIICTFQLLDFPAFDLNLENLNSEKDFKNYLSFWHFRFSP